ncbi:MAG: hypothetical protein Q9180_005235, partial [Flavoplaca navasiana]
MEQANVFNSFLPKSSRARFAVWGRPPEDHDRLRHEQLSKAMFSVATRPTIKGYTIDSDLTKPFISYLAHELLTRIKDYYQPILSACGFPPLEDKAQSMLRMVEFVVDIIKNRTGRKISINTVICEVGQKNDVGLDSKNLPSNVKQGMFGLLGFLTMLFEIPQQLTAKLEIAKPVEPLVLPTRKPFSNTKLPMGVLLASFGIFIPSRRGPEADSLNTWPPKYPDSVNLNTSVLNAYALTKIGKLKIEWSERFGSHLIFDRNTRTLFLFRFPTFCALNCSREGEQTLFDHIMDDREQPDHILANANRSMFREALLSYRLIFGQNLDSRRLFRFQEKKRASKDGYTDQLLVRLCGDPKDISVMSEDETLYEQAFYDSVIDFPHYGPRLEILQ